MSTYVSTFMYAYKYIDIIKGRWDKAEGSSHFDNLNLARLRISTRIFPCDTFFQTTRCHFLCGFEFEFFYAWSSLLIHSLASILHRYSPSFWKLSKYLKFSQTFPLRNCFLNLRLIWSFHEIFVCFICEQFV